MLGISQIELFPSMGGWEALHYDMLLLLTPNDTAI